MGGELVVVRADPLLTPVVLLNPPDTIPFDVSEVAARQGLAVATNAAMFATDYKTSIGYMRNFANVNNPRIASKLRGFLFFNPKSSKSPAVKIGGKEDLPAYNTAFQSHRMWDPATGAILWNKGASVYRQVALVGVDGKNRLLLFYHPNLIDVHEMVAQILELNLGLKGLLYLDGGNHGAFHLPREFGRGWNTWISIPNILGIKARDNKAN